MSQEIKGFIIGLIMIVLFVIGMWACAWGV